MKISRLVDRVMAPDLVSRRNNAGRNGGSGNPAGADIKVVFDGILDLALPEGKDKCLVTAGKKSLTGKDDDLSLEGKRIVLTDQVDRNRVSGGLVQRLQGNGMRSRDRLHGGQGSCDGDGILCK